MHLAVLERRRNHLNEKIRENVSLFLPMSKSVYFESLHLLYVTAKNEEAWTHYVSTDCYTFFCLKGSSISAFFFFDGGARKGGVLRTLPQHPPIVICVIILLGLDITLSLSLFIFREGGRVEFQVKVHQSPLSSLPTPNARFRSMILLFLCVLPFRNFRWSCCL